MYFEYGEKELIYLKQKDKRLAEVIDQVGMIERTVDDDLFSSVVHHIVGQQISTKAQATIWQRMKDYLGTVDADTILNAGVEHLQPLGISFRKAEYITDFAEKVGIVITERHRCLDCGNDPAVLYAKTECAEFW